MNTTSSASAVDRLLGVCSCWVYAEEYRGLGEGMDLLRVAMGQEVVNTTSSVGVRVFKEYGRRRRAGVQRVYVVAQATHFLWR